MTEPLTRVQTKAHRLWCNHGSWLLLLLIGISCFMAGSQFTALRVNDQFKMVIEAHDRQDAERIKRITRLMDDNKELSMLLGNTAGKVADKASEAAATASQAADTATEAVIKASEHRSSSDAIETR